MAETALRRVKYPNYRSSPRGCVITRRGSTLHVGTLKTFTGRRTLCALTHSSLVGGATGKSNPPLPAPTTLKDQSLSVGSRLIGATALLDTRERGQCLHHRICANSQMCGKRLDGYERDR